jgi:deferrochelatase/peroxidase EfeB
LTVTFGFGPTLFSLNGRDRFGLASARPAQLADLPPFPGVWNLARIGRGTVAMRWSQLGFGHTSSTSRAEGTPRNLMGFKDGTNNIKLEDEAALAEHVWAGRRDEPAWMQGGTYLVTRRTRMLIEVWDRASLGDQEATIGRTKTVGAPLGGRNDFDRVDLAAKGPSGRPVVPADAPIRLAAPVENGDVRIRAAAIPSPMAWIRASASSTPACSSSRTSGTRDGNSFRFSAVSRARMRSTSTSRTPAAPCSPARPVSGPATTSAARCSDRGAS